MFGVDGFIRGSKRSDVMGRHWQAGRGFVLLCASVNMEKYEDLFSVYLFCGLFFHRSSDRVGRN